MSFILTGDALLRLKLSTLKFKRLDYYAVVVFLAFRPDILLMWLTALGLFYLDAGTMFFTWLRLLVLFERALSLPKLFSIGLSVASSSGISNSFAVMFSPGGFGGRRRLAGD